MCIALRGKKPVAVRRSFCGHISFNLDDSLKLTVSASRWSAGRQEDTATSDGKTTLNRLDISSRYGRINSSANYLQTDLIITLSQAVGQGRSAAVEVGMIHVVKSCELL